MSGAHRNSLVAFAFHKSWSPFHDCYLVETLKGAITETLAPASIRKLLCERRSLISKWLVVDSGISGAADPETSSSFLFACMCMVKCTFRP